MNSIEIRGCVHIPKHVLRNDDEMLLRKSLVYVSKYDDGEPVIGYMETDTHFLVPKFWFHAHLAHKYQNIVDMTPTGPVQTWKFAASLRPHQRYPNQGYASFPQVANKLKALKGLFASAPCGSGKTVLGIYVAAQFGVPTIVVTPGETVRKQWLSAIKTFLPDLLATEYSGRKKDLSGDIVVASLQLLAKGPIARDFPLLIMDEAHMASTKEFQKASYYLNYRYSLALTATGNRFDGLDVLFRNALGLQEVELDTDQMPVTVLFEDYDIAYADEERMNTLNLSIPGRVDRYLELLTYRNTRLVKTIQSAYRKGRKLVVISKSIKQLMLLRTVFQQIEPEAKTALFTGDLTQDGKIIKELKRTKAQITEDERYVNDPDAVLFSTIGKAGVGWDCAGKDALILALPLLDIRQVLGRVQRYVPGKATPIALYPVDNFPTLVKRATGAYWGALWPLIQRKQCVVRNKSQLDLGQNWRTTRSSSSKSSTLHQGKFFTTPERGDR